MTGLNSSGCCTIIGHFTKDLKEDRKGFDLGGAVYYSGMAFSRLGFNVSIVSSFSDDLWLCIKRQVPLQNIKIENLNSLTSTEFLNLYDQGQRTQFTFHCAKKIGSYLTKPIKSEIVFLAPVFNELSSGLPKKIKAKIIALSLQGLLRGKNKRNEVIFKKSRNLELFLASSGICFASEEDIQFNKQFIRELLNLCGRLVLTRGEKGCRIFWDGKEKDFHPLKIVTKKDYTGAGDVFSAAFLGRFRATNNPWQSADFANRLAGFHLEKGIENYSVKGFSF